MHLFGWNNHSRNLKTYWVGTLQRKLPWEFPNLVVCKFYTETLFCALYSSLSWLRSLHSSCEKKIREAKAATNCEPHMRCDYLPASNLKSHSCKIWSWSSKEAIGNSVLKGTSWPMKLRTLLSFLESSTHCSSCSVELCSVRHATLMQSLMRFLVPFSIGVGGCVCHCMASLGVCCTAAEHSSSMDSADHLRCEGAWDVKGQQASDHHQTG